MFLGEDLCPDEQNGKIYLQGFKKGVKIRPNYPALNWMLFMTNVHT